MLQACQIDAINRHTIINNDMIVVLTLKRCRERVSGNRWKTETSDERLLEASCREPHLQLGRGRDLGLFVLVY